MMNCAPRFQLRGENGYDEVVIQGIRYSLFQIILYIKIGLVVTDMYVVKISHL